MLGLNFYNVPWRRIDNLQQVAFQPSKRRTLHWVVGLITTVTSMTQTAENLLDRAAHSPLNLTAHDDSTGLFVSLQNVTSRKS